LLNRSQPSANAIAAQNSLLKVMLLKQGEPRLGIKGYPAEGGLFASLLEKTGLYTELTDGWRFLVPGKSGQDPAGLAPLWAAADVLLHQISDRSVGINELYSLWQGEPYGIKKGLLPVLSLAYTLSRYDQIAFYRQGVFQSRLTELDVDYLVQDPSAIHLRWLDLNDMSQQLLLGLGQVVNEFNPVGICIGREPLEVARALVAVYEQLEPWTKRTTRVSASTIQIRSVFKQASDPNRFLFDELPALLGRVDALNTKDGIQAAVQMVRDSLCELRDSYHEMLSNIESLLMRELQASAESPLSLTSLRSRADNIRQVSGDLRLNAFIARLAQYEGADRDVEGLISLAVNKPPREWTDADLDQAGLELAKCAQQFLQTEAFARVKGRGDKRHAMAVVVGLAGQPTPVSHEFLVADEDQNEVHNLISLVDTALAQADTHQKHLILAALAEISARYMKNTERSSAPMQERAVAR
jgi:hypothetical protein